MLTAHDGQLNHVPITKAMWAWLDKHRPGAAQKLREANVTGMIVWAGVIRTLYEFPALPLPVFSKDAPCDWAWAEFDRSESTDAACIVTTGAPHFEPPGSEADPLSPVQRAVEDASHPNAEQADAGYVVHCVLVDACRMFVMRQDAEAPFEASVIHITPAMEALLLAFWQRDFPAAGWTRETMRAAPLILGMRPVWDAPHFLLENPDYPYPGSR